MKAIAYFPAGLALMLAWSLPGTTPLLAAAAQAKSAATTKPAKDAHARKDKDEDLIPQGLIDASRQSFVVVEMNIKKDTSEPLSYDEDYRISRLYEQYVDQKRPAQTAGVVLDDKGHILTFDSGLEDRYIASTTVVSGKDRFAAKRVKLLYDAPGVILQVDAKAAAKLKPLKFSPLTDKGANTVLYMSMLYRTEDQWRLRFGAARPSVPLEGTNGSDVFYNDTAYMSSSMYGSHYGTYGRVMILADPNGNCVGCATSPVFDLQQKECIWRGGDLVSAAGIEWDKLIAAENSCRARLLGAVQEIVLVLRQGDDSDSSRFSSSPSAAGREVSTYGLAINDTDVVVMLPINSRVARQIEKIYIKYSPTRRQEMRFVGAFREIGGFVVRLTKGTLPAHAELAGADWPRMKPFWTAKLRKRLGEKYVQLSTNRLVAKQRGYKGLYHWDTARSVPKGAFLVDFQGRIVGAYVHEKKENEEEQQLNDSRRYSSGSDTYRVFTISELRGLLTKPADHLDPKVQVTTRTLARRRAWLGVEYVPITPKLAEMMKVETPTRDGQIGLVINAIYDSSPAAKEKLHVGDILLKIQGPGMPYPMELAGQSAGYSGFFGGRWYNPSEDDGEGPVAPTWKNRRNFLTQALDAIGVGKTVRLTYYHPTAEGKGKTRTLNYKIELAPPDQDSAAHWKNRKLGLTVKDVTYEVRHALGLKGPAGVLVAKVESGSPILIAKIYPNEIITRLDDHPLSSVKQMRDMIAAAFKAGRTKVRVTVLHLGKTRQADLAIDEYNPADDEGLDEK